MRALFSRSNRLLSHSLDCGRKSVRGPRPSFFEPLEGRTMMSTTYYVSPGGSDSNKGTTTSAPWKSIAKVDSSSFKPGDSVLFLGGSSFSGTIQLRNDDGNSGTTPVVIGSYGSGHATIAAGGADGLYDYGTSGIWVENLTFTGQANGINQDGIRVEAPSGDGLSNVRVTGCTVSGFGCAGILFLGDGSVGISNTQITGNTVFDNVNAGILFNSNSADVHKNAYIADNNVYGNYGNMSQYNDCGSGIELEGMNDATVEHNTADDNGVHGDGGVGIWCYSSTDVTFQYNTSFDNHTSEGHDGDGFDFDKDTSDSVMQYNDSYGNDGNGYQINQWANDSDQTNDVVRYNISQNNGNKNNYAGIEAWGKVLNSAFYNNTVYVSAATSGGSPSGIKVHNATAPGLYVSNLTFANNLVVTTGSRPAVYVPSAELGGASNLKFLADDYYAAGGSFGITYGSNYSSVAKWASATGQEKSGGTVLGLEVNPALGGTSGTLSAASTTSTASFKLASSSPVINKGTPVPTIANIPAAATDYYGDKTPQGGKYDIGAYESGVAGTTATTTATATPTAPTSSTTTTPSTVAAPAGWTSSDIGSVGKAGSSVYASSTYTIAGAGSNIKGTSDSFHYDYTTLTGNGQVIAKVNSISDVNSWSKAGVMIRNGTATNAAEATLTVSPIGYADFSRRATAGASTTETDYKAKAPDWLKLVRNGNLITAYVSTNGTSWSTVGSETISMSSTIDIGLAVTSHNTGSTATGSFSDVSVT